MFERLKFIMVGLKENPLPTFCGLLIGAVIYLWLDNSAMHSKVDAMAERHRIDLLECEKNHAREMKTMLEDTNRELRLAAERQTRIEQEQKRLKKARK